MKKENNLGITRRNFIKTGAAAGAGLLLSGNILANTFSSLSTKKRYAIVGTGHRTEMWQEYHRQL